MNQGKIVEYIDHGDFIIALCLQDDGTRLHLLTPTNREMNLSPKRAILISKASFNAQVPREEILRNAQTYREQVFTASGTTPDECRRGPFTPVEVIPNRHIFVYNRGAWQ